MSVRIHCDRCGSVARIESSSQEADSYKKLYCSCKNPACGHSFVMDLTFSHTLSPSALDLPEAARQKIMSMGKSEQVELFAGLG